MKKAPETLNCNRLVRNRDRSCYCGFTGADWKNCQGGCHSCVEVPLAEKLLGQQSMKRQNQYIQEIRSALRADQAALALGAGISIPMGMPNWQALISQMAGHALKYQDYRSHYDNQPSEAEDHMRLSQLEKELIEQNLTLFNGINVLESGQYIAQTLGNFKVRKSGEELMKEIISVIVENSRKPQDFLANWLKENPEYGKTEESDKPDESKKEEMLQALARSASLCAAAYLLRAKNGFRRVLTYNFDTLVEEYLVKMFEVAPDRIVSYPGDWSTHCTKTAKDSIHIFHVHGCIPRKESQQDPSLNFLEESQNIVLSEDSYYDTERYEAYNWLNSIQSYYLNRNSCVFVGFSADDYNFRRILRQLGDPNAQRANRPKHYLILTIDELVKDTWVSICRSHVPRGTTPEDVRSDTLVLLQKILHMKENYWMRYGFYPIWVSINDIPQTLLSLL